MSQRQLNAVVALALAALLSVLAVIWPRPTAARPPGADFAAPMSRAAAAAALTAGQAREAQRRAVANQQLGVIDLGLLPKVQTVYFAETGHHLSNRAGFLDFWRANGQVLIFGYPISEEIIEGGRIVQYFERARFEYIPAQAGQAPQVQLGLIGRELAQMQGQSFPAPERIAEGATLFPETGHTIWGEFRRYWERRGGLAIFGFPLSENTDEDGRIVQYFERARFEYHPEDLDGFFRSMESANGFNLNSLFEVRLSDIGRQLATLKGVNTASVPQLAGTATWSPGIWQRHIDVDLTAQWLTAYEGGLVVYRAPVATGRDGFNTPAGNYAIYYRLPMQRMASCMGGECWDVPNIPWVQYIVGGVAFHGTYWHDAHGTGTRMSHGCVNLKIDDAQWLYEWADIGTTVRIHY